MLRQLRRCFWKAEEAFKFLKSDPSLYQLVLLEYLYMSRIQKHNRRNKFGQAGRRCSFHRIQMAAPKSTLQYRSLLAEYEELRQLARQQGHEPGDRSASMGVLGEEGCLPPTKLIHLTSHPIAIGNLRHSSWTEPKTLKGLGLLSTGVDAAGAEAIYMASIEGNSDALVDALATRSEQSGTWSIVDRYGFEPLAQAAARGHLAVCNSLIEGGAEVQAVGQTCGRTALHRAAEFGAATVIERLIEAQADVTTEALDGSVATHMAAALGHEDAVRALLSARALPDHADSAGRTPLMVAAEGNHASVVRLLCEMGAIAATADLNGWAALHHACAASSSAAAHALVELGASVSSKTRGGVTLSHLDAVLTQELEAVASAAHEAEVDAIDDGEVEEAPLA